MDMFTEAIIMKKISNLMESKALILKTGHKIVLGLSNGKHQLAIVAQNETLNEEQLLPYNVDFSHFLNTLAEL